MFCSLNLLYVEVSKIFYFFSFVDFFSIISYAVRLKAKDGPLLAARRLYNVQNYLLRRSFFKEKGIE